MNLAQIGTITPPNTIPTVSPGGESEFIAGVIRGSIQFLLITAFIVAFFWTIFAGYRFITAGGDSKTISSAWSQIYWGLIGMVVVFGSFAIIRIVEIFFNVNLISGGFVLPTR